MKIAFGCQSRIGKDTACEYLKNKYGGTVLAFSDPLYHIMNYSQSYLNFPVEKDTKFLQWIGTEWARQKDPNVWVKLLTAKINDSDNFFVSDVRFLNEFQALKNLGFTTIRIIRPDRPIDRDQFHSSETELISSVEWDHVIINDGTLDKLFLDIDAIINLKKE